LSSNPSPEPVSDRVRLLKESKVFCMAPWTHLSVQPSGAVLPCCLGTSGPPLGSLRTQSIEIVWNSAVMRGLRRNMLSGKESPQCVLCYEQEALGLRSLRQDLNWSSLSQFPVVETTREDGSVDKLNLPWLEIRFSNICNFKCRNCGPHYSSAWHADAAAMDMPVPEQPLMRPDADPAHLWRQVEELLPNLEQFSFVGGEPLLMEEHWRLLNLLIERKMFHVGLNYTTNFSIMSHEGQDAMKLWKKFRFVSVTASLDGMGARGEYLRHGQDWDLVLRNRKRLLETCPKARFSLLATVSAMNALHLPDFHREWIEKGLIRPNDFMLNILREPKEYSVQILPAAMKDKIEARYREHVETFLPSTGLPHLAAAASFRAVVAHMRAQDQSRLLDRFRRTTLTLDRLRGENFAEVFPELAELVKTP
jgi:MoaA/NifB/PqqE/SkfB family radical SAM enzyme